MTPISAPPKHTQSVDGTHPVVSTRYDPVRIRWATQQLGVKRAELLRLALDRFIDDLNRQSAA